MTTAIARLSHLERALLQLAVEIRNKHRSLLSDLRIETIAGGVVLRGHAYTFYGKQIAFHEVRRRCQLAVVANRITVE